VWSNRTGAREVKGSKRIQSQYTLWVALLLVSGIPRILGAFFLPNEEGDPYSYIQAIQVIRASMVGGTFTISELFGFWLPLYQFVCAVISLVVGHPLYVAKLVSAVCGTGVCIVVFRVSLQLTANKKLSLLAFALIALNPIHITYSAFSMTDVPHAFLVISSLYFAIKNRWVLAASFVALGSLMRIESWLLVLLLPALQFFLHRKVSLAACCVALFSPLFWLYISWAASGNPFEYFKVRRDYINNVLADPGLRYFSPGRSAVNIRMLVYATGPAVIVACLIAASLIFKRFRRQPATRFSQSASATVATVAYFFSFLGFILLAYLTKNQPDIWVRYCLILFSLGTPVLAWVLLASKVWAPRWATRLSVLLLAFCLWQWSSQLVGGAHFLAQVSQKRVVAHCLRDRYQADTGHKVFCDDATVQVLSGIPGDRFLDSPNSPTDPEEFLDYLKKDRVEYLVYAKREDSIAVGLFRHLGEGQVKEHFELIECKGADPSSSEPRLYRTVF
jgi:hypothetical protein